MKQSEEEVATGYEFRTKGTYLRAVWLYLQGSVQMSSKTTLLPLCFKGKGYHKLDMTHCFNKRFSFQISTG